MKLIVGLGNPGDKYHFTRHNIGFLVLDEIVKYYGFNQFKYSSKFKADISEGMIEGEKILLVKPQTYMNLSGQSLVLVKNFYKFENKDIIIIYDDVEVDIGKIRIKPSGSAGGHNGMKSILELLGTKDVTRVKIGLKPLIDFKGKLEDFVLGKITEDEKITLFILLNKLPKLMSDLIKKDINEVMQDYN